jgi:hypothetical protein
MTALTNVAGPYQSIVRFAITAGTVFRIFPFAVGALFLLFQHRITIANVFKQIPARISNLSHSVFASWRRFRCGAATSNEGLHAELRPSETRRDGSLFIGSAPSRAVRLSEMANAYLVPQAGRDSGDAFEGSMAELK